MNASTLDEFHFSCLCSEDVKLIAAIVNGTGAVQWRGGGGEGEISALDVNPHVWDPSHELRKIYTKAQTL